MGLKLEVLPDQMLRLIPPGQRPGVLTMNEIAAAQAYKYEKKFQEHVANLLRQRDIYFVRAPINQKSQLPPGHADFTVFLPGGKVGFLELKSEGGVWESNQKEFCQKMRALG